MSHPVLHMEGRKRYLLLAVLVSATLIMAVTLYYHGDPLKNPEACAGIVSLEMPFTQQKAVAVMNSWQARAQLDLARADIRIDFLFLLLYPAAFSLFLVVASAWKTTGWTRMYVGMAWLALLMMPLDAVENLLMLQMLDAHPQPEAWMIAATTLSAGLKFLILFAATFLVLRALLRPIALKLLGGKFGQS